MPPKTSPAMVIIIVVITTHCESPECSLELAQLVNARSNVYIMAVYEITYQGNDIGLEGIGHRHNVPDIGQWYERTMMHVGQQCNGCSTKWRGEVRNGNCRSHNTAPFS